MDLTEKLKIVMLKLKVSQTALAECTGQTQNNLANKMKLNNFKLSEYEKLVQALGCELEINIILPTGEKV
jgi:DNA-binding Xre family transcriptional regulator